MINVALALFGYLLEQQELVSIFCHCYHDGGAFGGATTAAFGYHRSERGKRRGFLPGMAIFGRRSSRNPPVAASLDFGGAMSPLPYSNLNGFPWIMNAWTLGCGLIFEKYSKPNLTILCLKVPTDPCLEVLTDFCLEVLTDLFLEILTDFSLEVLTDFCWKFWQTSIGSPDRLLSEVLTDFCRKFWQTSIWKSWQTSFLEVLTDFCLEVLTDFCRKSWQISFLKSCQTFVGFPERLLSKVLADFCRKTSAESLSDFCGKNFRKTCHTLMANGHSSLRHSLSSLADWCSFVAKDTRAHPNQSRRDVSAEKPGGCYDGVSIMDGITFQRVAKSHINRVYNFWAAFCLQLTWDVVKLSGFRGFWTLKFHREIRSWRHIDMLYNKLPNFVDFSETKKK